jgi:hypothetical protein
VANAGTSVPILSDFKIMNEFNPQKLLHLCLKKRSVAEAADRNN